MSLSGFASAIDEAKKAQTRPERLSLIARAIREHSDAVSSAPASDREALLLELSAIPGMASNMPSIRKSLKPKPTIRLATDDEPANPIELDGVELPLIVAPPKWIVTNAGIVHLIDRDGETVPSQTTLRPLVVTGMLEDLSTNMKRVYLEWREHRRGWRSTIAKMSDLQDSRALVRLSDQGAPISAKNARHMSEYISEMVESNPSIPMASSTRSLGWADGGKLGFLWGKKLITEHGESKAASSKPTTWDDTTVFLDIDEEDGKTQLIEAYHSRGAFSDWSRVFHAATSHPSAAIGVYMSLIAPALILFEHQINPVIEWAGETSKGKTTAMVLAASVWGEPTHSGGIIQKWNSTAKGLEEIWATNSYLPTFLDDTKDVPKKLQGGIPSSVYMFSGGTGKSRGTINGMAKTVKFKGVLFSTGESPITSFSQDAGARARVLGLHGSPWGDRDQSKLVEDVTMTCVDNYGHAGPRVVEWLSKNKDKWPAIRESYMRTVHEYEAKADSTVGKRAAKTIAYIKLGIDLARKIGLEPPVTCPLSYAWDRAMSASVDADRPAAALRDIYSWCVEHSVELWGRHVVDRDGCARQPSMGWAGAWKKGESWTRIGITQTAMRRLLSREGYEPDAIFQSWGDRGWLIRDGRSIAAKMTVGPDKARPRVICVKREAIEEVMNGTL